MELEIEGSHEAQFAIMRSAVIELHAAVKGNGRDGLIRDFDKLCERFDTFLEVQAAIETEKSKFARSQVRRMNTILVVIGTIVIPLVIAILLKK